MAAFECCFLVRSRAIILYTGNSREQAVGDSLDQF